MSENNNTNEKTSKTENTADATERIKRNFLTLSPEKKAESLVLLLELAKTVGDKEKSEHLMGVYNTLKNLGEKQDRSA